jgi:hypothetical protein
LEVAAAIDGVMHQLTQVAGFSESFQFFKGVRILVPWKALEIVHPIGFENTDLSRLPPRLKAAHVLEREILAGVAQVAC